jgi:hypothetical protein
MQPVCSFTFPEDVKYMTMKGNYIGIVFDSKIIIYDVRNLTVKEDRELNIEFASAVEFGQYYMAIGTVYGQIFSWNMQNNLREATNDPGRHLGEITSIKST